MDVVVLLVALAGLATAAAALVLVLRERAVGGADHVSSTRQSEHERQIAQLVKRIDVLESEIDGSMAARAAVESVGEDAAGGGAVRQGGATVSHIGVVRFDAFEDAGGAQSFALALLDDSGDGIVLTSLHSRPTTRLYIKAIRSGAADAPLSEEETRALQEAGLPL